MSESRQQFVWPVRVYYEDTDAAGVVYYANYLKFMERARTEWLRALGMEQGELLQCEGVVFVVREVSVSYRMPARYGDALQVVSELVQLRPMRMRFSQRVERGGVLAEGEIEVVCVNAQTFKPVMLPRRVQQLLEQLER